MNQTRLQQEIDALGEYVGGEGDELSVAVLLGFVHRLRDCALSRGAPEPPDTDWAGLLLAAENVVEQQKSGAISRIALEALEEGVAMVKKFGAAVSRGPGPTDPGPQQEVTRTGPMSERLGCNCGGRGQCSGCLKDPALRVRERLTITRRIDECSMADCEAMSALLKAYKERLRQVGRLASALQKIAAYGLPDDAVGPERDGFSTPEECTIHFWVREARAALHGWDSEK